MSGKWLRRRRDIATLIVMKTLLSFGHGFSARALAKLLVPQGWRIIATTRSDQKFEAFEQEGVEPRLFPGDSLSQDLQDATHILISAGPDKDGDPVLNALGPAIADKARDLMWAGYLSTTGVYGDHKGAWIDENTPLTPSTRRGQWRMNAETAWRAVPGLPLHIFRLAGIYGPGRGPFAKVRNGTARRIIKKNQVFSRIHVDDIAQIVAASIQKPNPGGVYNVCDDDPAPPQDVIAHAAELLRVPIPDAVDFETADMSPMARSFYAESKRVRNTRIKDELGVKLHYPNYKVGLAALLEAEQTA